MKILFFMHSLAGGGAERVCCTLARHFHSLGHEIEFLTIHEPRVAYELPAGTKVSQLKTGFLARSFGKIIFLPVFAIELAIHIRRRPDFQCLSLLTRANLAHIFTRLLGNRKRIIISERCTSVDYSQGWFTKRPLGMLVRLFYRFADHIIAISEGVKDGLVDYKISADQITTIHNPQPIGEIQKKAQMESSYERRSGFQIVMAGRLTEQKDYPTMLKALSVLIHQFHTDAYLTIMGEGHLLLELQNLSRQLQISERIEWLGFRSDAYQIFSKADAFVFSSIYEGFGNVLVEAMACQLPVVSTDCKSGPAEILDDGRYGALVPVGDFEALAKSLLALIQDQNFRKNSAERAAQGAERFDVSKIAPRYLKILEGSRA